MLTLDTGAIALFRLMLQIPGDAKVFLHNIDQTGGIAQPFIDHNCLVSGVCPREHGFYKYHASMAKNSYHEKKRIEVVAHEDMAMIKPPQQFLYAFGFPEFNDDGSFVTGQDHLRHWNVSKYDSQHYAPRHLMALESLHAATLPGGFFGAVMPRQWMGKYMRFMKWWRVEAPMVAKIRLPRLAVKRFRDYDWSQDSTPELVAAGREYEDEIVKPETLVQQPMVSTGNWMLFIWQKPVPREGTSRTNRLFFATFRYSGYVGSLKPMDSNNTGLEEEAVEYCSAGFRKSDWCKYSVRPFTAMINESSDAIYGRSSYDQPVVIRSPKDMRIIQVSDKNKPKFFVRKTVEDISKDPLAVHIKLGPPTKLYAYSPQAMAGLHELRFKAGFEREETQKEANSKDYRAKDMFTVQLKRVSFIENRDWLLKTICDAGMSPYLTESDASRLAHEERWLNIQLTPIVRTVKVPSPDNGDEWEQIYDDVDIKATFPEIWNMWVSRAKKMKLHLPKFTYDFQFEDIVTMACKQSITNSNVMGLGKTRETLFAILLMGIKKSLIVVPTRLIGVWQEEIETTIANYVRLVRRNWMGDRMASLMSADVQVIQWARDCRTENLRTFNLISYENLPRVPKDALFFKCPACSFVICSPLGCDEQACPRCNHGKVQAAKKLNELSGKKKRHGRGGVVIDDRVSSGNPVMMEQVEQVYDKMKKIQVGFDRNYDESTQEWVQVPVMKEVERTPHLRWTFSNLLRNSFKLIAVDESNYVNNPKAQRSLGLMNLRAPRRISNTGTPVRGYPKSICNIYNWVFKRSVFPDYRSDGSSLDAGVNKFQKKYATFVEREGKTPKLVPKINQPELFQQEIAPLMIRHIRHEPNVAKSVPPRTPTIESKIIPMDPEHRAYYQRWLEVFAEWWALKRIEEDNQTNARVVNDLLVKMGYLVNASTIPHFMLDELEGEDGKAWAQLIGKYQGKNLTQKFLATTKMIEKNIEAGDKTMVGCWRRKNLMLGEKWCKAHKPPIYSLKIDGSVSNQIKEGVNRSEKQIRVDAFRHRDYHVMWAGIATMKEGYNIPEANHAILMDYTWEPADTEQFIARMLRPAQKKPVFGTFMCHKGTVDEYVAALVQLKWKSAQEGVDYIAFDDWSADMVPDFVQYANSIVDGTDEVLRTKMWTDVERLRREIEENEGEGEGDNDPETPGNGGGEW